MLYKVSQINYHKLFVNQAEFLLAWINRHRQRKIVHLLNKISFMSQVDKKLPHLTGAISFEQRVHLDQ